MSEYAGPERRREVHLSERQIEMLADRVVEKLLARTAKGAIGKLSALGVMALIGVLAWLAGSGRLPS